MYREHSIYLLLIYIINLILNIVIVHINTNISFKYNSKQMFHINKKNSSNNNNEWNLECVTFKKFSPVINSYKKLQ
jgi:hypothetical protein